jgi:hypothetical protein
MGLKTAACWIGNRWVIRTKKLGETVEHVAAIDVNEIAEGRNDLNYRAITNKSADSHYTIIEITQHNREFHGRTLGKIRNYLRSMYRVDFRNGVLKLEWQGSALAWDDFYQRLLVSADGERYYKTFEFDVHGNQVTGWVGILEKGTRADAGFSILQCDRVIRGWPDSWRPTVIYGQEQGSNDLVNQRLLGEINLDGFEVSHTKDDILWLDDQEEIVEKKLLEACRDYREYAIKRRKASFDSRGPSDLEVKTAILEFQQEITSPELVDQMNWAVPSQEAAIKEVERLSEVVTSKSAPEFSAQIDSLLVKIYVSRDLSPTDLYFASESPDPSTISVIVNMSHPHFSKLAGSEGVLNFLRHCTYDAIAEWQAMNRAARIDPDTIKILKDRLLRVPLEIERHNLP